MDYIELASDTCFYLYLPVDVIRESTSEIQRAYCSRQYGGFTAAAVIACVNMIAELLSDVKLEICLLL